VVATADPDPAGHPRRPGNGCGDGARRRAARLDRQPDDASTARGPAAHPQRVQPGPDRRGRAHPHPHRDGADRAGHDDHHTRDADALRVGLGHDPVPVDPHTDPSPHPHRRGPGDLPTHTDRAADAHHATHSHTAAHGDPAAQCHCDRSTLNGRHPSESITGLLT
jgi:hypothetical protein